MTRRIQCALSAGPAAQAHHRGPVLEPCAPEILRARRHHRERTAWAECTPISPLALAAVERIDRLFDIERTITGLGIDERLAVRQAQSAPLVAELEAWMHAESQRLSKHAEVARAMSYMLRHWEGFTRFLQDGRACLSNNAAERALRGISLGRKS